MSRNHEKLKVFELADELVPNVYHATSKLPTEERYGLQSQIRRAAVSAVVNIVEGCARSTTRDYLHFLTISHGSVEETKYLLGLTIRLALLNHDEIEPLIARYKDLSKALQGLINSLQPPT